MLQTISREIEFDASHRLLDSPESPCYRMHGHRYKVIAYITGFLNSKGYIIDFGQLKNILYFQVHDPLDHQFINTIVGETNATVERMIEWAWPRIAEQVARSGALLTKMTIYETPTCEASFELPIQYIAAMIDGEGSICQSGNTEIQLRISNTNLEMLESLKSEVGSGSIQKAKRNIKATKDCYSLVFSRRIARLVCAVCLPYFRVKKAQAELCISFGPYETGRGKLSDFEWERRARILSSISKFNGHGRIWTAQELKDQQEKFRKNRRLSASKSYDSKRKRKT